MIPLGIFRTAIYGNEAHRREPAISPYPVSDPEYATEADYVVVNHFPTAPARLLTGPSKEVWDSRRIRAGAIATKTEVRNLTNIPLQWLGLVAGVPSEMRGTGRIGTCRVCSSEVINRADIQSKHGFMCNEILKRMRVLLCRDKKCVMCHKTANTYKWGFPLCPEDIQGFMILNPRAMVLARDMVMKDASPAERKVIFGDGFDA
jgi:hypothetical protein